MKLDKIYRYFSFFNFLLIFLKKSDSKLKIEELVRANTELESRILVLKISHQKLSSENHNKDQFLATVAHEMRNQVGLIVSISDFMKSVPRSKFQDSEYLEFTSDIYNVAREVMEFVNDLMDVNQSESGKFSIKMDEEIDIINIIKRSIKLNYGLSSKRNIQIQFNNQIKVSNINLDQRRMKQILANLISNALKYSKEDSIVTIDAKEETIDNNSLDSKKQIIISVKDQGIGMSENDIKMALSGEGTKIVKSSLGKDIDSHGIGLPLVKQLVEMQKGEMEIESQINQGTEIKIKFQYLM